MARGRHLLVDCSDVPPEVCLDDRAMLAAMSRAAECAGATVISQVRYAFGKESPPGFAAFVLLDESHCSAHSYADSRQIAIDIFTCGHVEPESVLRRLRQEIDLGQTRIRTVERFDGSAPAESVRPPVAEQPGMVDGAMIESF